MNRTRILYALWIAGIAALYFLHFPHILADFPNHSPWLDESKYTDEGWYASAAVRHAISGHWYLRGDFNPAVALPVWPLLLSLVFHFSGVSLAAARISGLAVLGINLLLSYFTLRTQAPRWVALTAVSILVTNPFLYAFSRLALLEPLAVCLLLLSWMVALRLSRAPVWVQTPLLAATGLILCLLVLTKTTGVFLIPSTLFLVAYPRIVRWRTCLPALAITTMSAVILWCAWYFLLVRPRYRVDYEYLFEANAWPQPAGFVGHAMAYWWALRGMLWISPVLCFTACAAAAALLLLPARQHFARTTLSKPDDAAGFWSHPLVLASLLAVAGTIFFVGYSNHPQPRYYEAAVYPLAFFLALSAGELARQARAAPVRAMGAAALAAVAGACLAGTAQIAAYVRFPEYTWLHAAQGVARTIRQHPEANGVLLSISGAQLQLMTHIPSLCDDFGTWDLPYRIHVYQPSWYATWNEMDPGTLTDLQTQYSTKRVAEFWAMDDPDRDHLILFRLIPLPQNRQQYVAAEEELENAGK